MKQDSRGAKMSFNSNNGGQSRKGELTVDEKVMLEWQQEMANNDPIGASERTYYKDLDFKSIKIFYKTLTQYYNAMERMLQVVPVNEKEFKELLKMRQYLFKKIEEQVDGLTFDWVEATASFSGSSGARQEAYESIIDEVKAAISSCSPATNKDELEMFMITFKHFVKWLMSESLPYSIGERVDSTDSQRLMLEDHKITVAAGPDAMNKGQQINRSSLNSSRSPIFRKKGSPSPPSQQPSDE